MSEEHNPELDDNERNVESMADEAHIDTTSDVPPPGDDDAAGNGDEPGVGDPSGDGPGPAAAGPTEPEGLRWSRSILNMQIGGRLVVHHLNRDVTVLVDGDSAIRAIEYFARREGRGDLDRLSSRTSSAEFGWVSMDLTGVIGMSWWPGFDDAPVEDRLTFDPLIRAA